MDLLTLRQFQVVARHEHVGRAAEDLRVAQPSLSRTIARLEADLGVPLFDRHGRRVRLNRFGVAYLRRVERALGELDDARRELDDAAGLAQGSVAVASETLLTLSWLLRDFLAQYPGADVRLYQTSADTMLDQLRRGEVDLCLASQPLDDPSLDSVELLREEVLLAVPPTHRLADRDRVAMADLAGEPFVTTRPGSWVRTLLDQLFRDAGLRPTIACEGTSEPAVTLQLVKVGLGMGLIPAMGRQAATDTAIPCLSLDAPNCHRDLMLVWRRDAYLSIAAQRFRELAATNLPQPGVTDVNNTG